MAMMKISASFPHGMDAPITIGSRAKPSLGLGGKAPGQGGRGTKSSWSWHFKFRRLISQNNYLVNLRNSRLHSDAGARLRQHIMTRDQMDKAPLKLTTFSYFRD